MRRGCNLMGLMGLPSFLYLLASGMLCHGPGWTMAPAPLFRRACEADLNPPMHGAGRVGPATFIIRASGLKNRNVHAFRFDPDLM